MDEDNFRRGPATFHQLEPVDYENVSNNARVARNVLHIRGEDNVKFDRCQRGSLAERRPGYSSDL